MKYKEMKEILDSLKKISTNNEIDKSLYFMLMTLYMILNIMAYDTLSKYLMQYFSKDSSTLISIFTLSTLIISGLGVYLKFFFKRQSKRQNKLKEIFNYHKKEMIRYLSQNIPLSMIIDNAIIYNNTLDDLKVNITDEKYFLAVENIKELLPQIEKTTERMNKIKDFDDAINLDEEVLIEEKEKEINFIYKL